MSRTRRQSAATASNAGGLARYVRLENRLVLLARLNSLLGYKSPNVWPRALMLRGGASFIIT